MIRSGFKPKAFPARQLRTERAFPVPLQRIGIQTRCDEMAAPGQPKAPRFESRRLLDLARGMPCLLRSPICVGGTDTTVACHGAGIANGKGLGYKVGDHMTVWGCWRCNHYTDAYSGATAKQKLQVFMAGHLRQVLEWRQIASGPASADQRAAAAALIQLNATPVGLIPSEKEDQ